MTNKKTIIIATIKSWNLVNAEIFKETFCETLNVRVIDNPRGLTSDIVSELRPQYIFFPHWSWMIPREIYGSVPCVVFHIADLPYGRGGSPIQNLIMRKIYKTKISAIAVGEGVDTGDVYCKLDFDLSIGTVEELLATASEKIFSNMIPRIIREHPTPVKQAGTVLEFKRRKPEESNMLTFRGETLRDYYDFIRMLDGEGYPRAFISFGNTEMKLSGVQFIEGKLTGRFEIHEK